MDNNTDMTRRPKVSVMQKVSSNILPIIIVVLFGVFSIMLPKSFPTVFNIKSLLNYQSIVVLLSLAVMIPIAAGHFDLSVGYGVALLHNLTAGFLIYLHMPWWSVIIIILALGICIGLFNGFLVTKVGIDSFIATLGTGTILYGLAFWYTGGTQILGKIPNEILALNSTIAGVIPTATLITLILAFILWIVFEYTPLGRYMYAIGSNVKAAELTGIKTKKYLVIAFAGSGLFTAIASIIIVSLIRVGQISVGADYLLPSFAGALLGATSIKVGRVNVWGTVFAVLMLAVAVSGLQQLGASYFVSPLFNGSVLILAVALSIYTGKRRIATGKIYKLKNTNKQNKNTVELK